MARVQLIITVLAFAILSSTHVNAADTLADMDIVVSPELMAQGIDPGVKHATLVDYRKTVTPETFIGAMVLSREASAQTPTVILIGDSIFARIPSFDLGSNVINLGVGGFTTAQILAIEVPKIPLSASRVIVEGGINDMLNPGLTNTLANYTAILAKIPATASIGLIGILPTNDAQLATNRGFIDFVSNAQVSVMQSKITALCTGRCTVVPSPFGPSLPAGLTIGDGVHPNLAGNAILAKVLH